MESLLIDIAILNCKCCSKLITIGECLVESSLQGDKF